MQDNVATAVNLLEALRLRRPTRASVWVSSCEVYGGRRSCRSTEDAPLAPANPYAVSKAAGELLAGVYADAYGLDIVRARPFSHAGPGQRPIFLLSSLARQAAEARPAGPRAARSSPATRTPAGTSPTCATSSAPTGCSPARRTAGGVYNVSSGALGVGGRAGALAAPS